MAAPEPRSRVVMECIEGNWEPFDDGQRCRYRGRIRFVMTQPARPELPPRIYEVDTVWEQPTPSHYLLVPPAPLIEISSSFEEEEDPDEDPSVDVDLAPEPEVIPAQSEDGGNHGPADTDPSSEMRFYWRASAQSPRRPAAAHFRVESSSLAESSVGSVPVAMDEVGPSDAVRMGISPEQSDRESGDGSHYPDRSSAGGH
jgi:hypothetical protein